MAMAINKPFPRIYLPLISDKQISFHDYLNDACYIDKREASSLIGAARLIVEDYSVLCEYIEPVDANKNTFSHRTYELLLRVATEFETNCKGILIANGYSSHGNLNIQDYYKINQIMHLDQYEIETNLWSPEKKFRPLNEWSTGHTLTWYQAYNHSKHNRYGNFYEATMENVFNGICSLAVLLAAQFPSLVGGITGRSNLSFFTEDPNSLITQGITIKYPILRPEQKYDFDWKTLKKNVSPFDYFPF